ncbi:hypothetical protein HUN41_00284 [Streptomyces phage Coruscant]|uniref:Uncharacterized protein n=1 Tax=Streptomyces phage Coruscant TaxID=2739834 RepID=A0A7G4AVV8_9CAUD|nr:hypothetical protein PP454_gp018 [Streptomyces phage Coruscant]YP_010651607.1 hypothetical protein PP454_gp045 [Streptomyces phage Coruscant]QMP84148.1 hypothetical protein HUN41_00018 [Streptomyces phage Coruscant]QMP84372.1 hypothetical protein HUN41_00284 [Streptomyces phage Coruscant]
MEFNKKNLTLGAAALWLINLALLGGAVWLVFFMAHLGWNAVN